MSLALRKAVYPARASNSKMGRPVSLLDVVPGKDRMTRPHRIFWANSSNKTADAYNSVVTIYKKPCMRRWLEFVGGRVPKTLPYISLFPPDPVESRPDRYWTVLRDGDPLVSYTSCVEAWLIVLGGEHFSRSHRWAMVYVDLTGRHKLLKN